MLVWTEAGAGVWWRSLVASVPGRHSRGWWCGWCGAQTVVLAIFHRNGLSPNILRYWNINLKLWSLLLSSLSMAGICTRRIFMVWAAAGINQMIRLLNRTENSTRRKWRNNISWSFVVYILITTNGDQRYQSIQHLRCWQSEGGVSVQFIL